MTSVRGSAAAHRSGIRHDFERVEGAGAAFVLCCTCGWRSGPSRSAEAVGTAWDHHRAEVGATDW